MKTNFYLAVIVFLLCICPVFAQELVLEKSVQSHKGLDQVYRRFSEGYRKLDAVMVANLYTETAGYLAPGNEIQIGQQNILKNFQSFFDSVRKENGKLEIRFRIFQRQVERNMAYDIGIYTLISTNVNGQANESSGKFVVVAKRQKNNLWLFQVDGYSDLPKPKTDK